MNGKKTLKFLVSLASCSLVVTLSGCKKKDDTSLVKYNVSFYEGENLLSSVQVEENSKVEKPTDPVKEGYDFKGWYTEVSLEHEFDFSTLITHDTNLYASFVDKDYFAKFDTRFKTNYSPIESEDIIYDDVSDPTLTFSTQTLTFNQNITSKMVSLDGAFVGLKINDVSLSEGKIVVTTTGKVLDGVGYVYFAKEVTNQNEYFVTKFDIVKRGIFVDESTIDVNFEENKINFLLNIEGDTLKNEEGLTNEEYLSKIKDKTYDFFKVSNTEKFSLEVNGLSEDLTSLVMTLKSNDDISLDLVDQIKENKIYIEEGAFESLKRYETSVDLSKVSTTSEIFISQKAVGEYVGEYQIHLNNARLTSEFLDYLKDNSSVLLDEEHSKNLFMSINGHDLIVTSIMSNNKNMIYGSFKIESEYLQRNDVTINLKPIKISDELILKIGKSIFNDDPVFIDIEKTPYTVGTRHDNAGKITQTEMSTYSSIKSVIQDYSFIEEDTTLTDIIKGATKIGMIGAGIYTKDFTMAKNAFGDIIGVDALRNPCYVILDRLVEVMQELAKIQDQIQAISEQLNTIEQELRDIGAEAYLDTYLSARTAYSLFISDYYNPVVEIMSSYTNDYFRYFHDFAMSTLEKRSTTDIEVKLYYDFDGNLVFANNNETTSVDGKIIDKSKTKIIPIYELSSTIAGILKNEDHAYNGIENDILCDLANRSDFSEDELIDILKTIRFNAMNKYFEDDQNKSNYVNKFKNFCSALTGTDIYASEIAFTPLDAYRVMTETVYNFGFEVESDINIAIIKLTSIYATARQILSFVGIIDRGLNIKEEFKELDVKVKAELENEKFFHHNDAQGNPFSYAAGVYVRPEIHSYSVYLTAVGGMTITGPIKLVDENWYADSDNTDVIPTEAKPISVTSISEADVKLMALKLKVFNNLKQTHYTFQEYLALIGILPEDTYRKVTGIILEVDTLVYGFEEDDVKDLKFNGDLIFYDDENWTQSISSFGDGYYLGALKGKIYSLIGNDICTAIVGLAEKPEGSQTLHTGGFFYSGSDSKTKGGFDTDLFVVEAIAYHLMFVPVV